MNGQARMFVAAGALAALTSGAMADEVIHWNNVLLNAIRATGGPPCPIGRAIAMTQVAVYDAVNSIDGTREPYLGFVDVPAGASMDAAVAGAAHRVLSTLYPSLQTMLDTELAATLANVPDGAPETGGLAVGHAAADAIIAARADDGSTPVPAYVFGTNPGDYVTPEDFPGPPNTAFSPHWGHTTPFSMITGDQFRPNGPLNFHNKSALLRSRGYAEQVNEVKSLGSRNSTTRGDEGTRIAFFWANDVDGTYKPPGHLCSITQAVSADRHLSLVQNARLFALVGLAMGDAGVVAWDCKYDVNMDLWRPITAIRRADTDNNHRTAADPAWLPLNPFTPPFPTWVSGHSTFGAAHAGVMAEFFGTDNVTFTVDSEDPFYNALPVHGPRTFHRFSDAALENAISRVYLGVHFPMDCVDGNHAGLELGHYIGRTFFRGLTPDCPADFNGDGRVNGHDLFDFIHAFLAGDDSADLNGDGDVDREDFLSFIRAFVHGC